MRRRRGARWRVVLTALADRWTAVIAGLPDVTVSAPDRDTALRAVRAELARYLAALPPRVRSHVASRRTRLPSRLPPVADVDVVETTTITMDCGEPKR